MTEKSLATWRDENTVEAKIIKMKVKRYSCRTSRRVNRVTNRTEIQQIQDSCCADRSQMSKPSRKPWRFTKLQFIDISVNVAEVNSNGACGFRAYSTKTFPQCVPCRKLRKESYSIFDWDSWNLGAGANNARGTENCGSSTERIAEVPGVQKEQIQ